MELDEILRRRAKVQQYINAVPFFSSVDFVVRPDKNIPNFVQLPVKRGVSTYKTISQGVGMLMDIPISYFTEDNPYTQGMYVVYDTELAYPYPWYTYPPEVKTKKRVVTTEYVVPPDSGAHAIPANFICFTPMDIQSLVTVAVNLIGQKEMWSVMLWEIIRGEIAPPENRSASIDMMGLILNKTDNTDYDSGEFEVQLFYGANGEKIYTQLYHLSLAGGISQCNPIDEIIGSSEWPIKVQFNSKISTNLIPNETLLGLTIPGSAYFYINGERPEYQDGIIDELLVLGIWTPSTTNPTPPDPAKSYDLYFVRPSGIIAREADIYELTAYNTSNPLSRDKEQDDDIPQSNDPNIPGFEYYTIPPETNRHDVVDQLFGIGFNEIYLVAVAMTMATTDLSSRRNRIDFWEIELISDELRGSLYFIGNIKKPTPKIIEDDEDPVFVPGTTIFFGWTTVINAPKSEWKGFVWDEKATSALVCSVVFGETINDYSIIWDENIGVMGNELYNIEFMNLNPSEESEVLSPDAHTKVKLTFLDEIPDVISLQFFQRAATRTELFTEANVLSTFPLKDVTWPVPEISDEVIPFQSEQLYFHISGELLTAFIMYYLYAHSQDGSTLPNYMDLYVISFPEGTTANPDLRIRIALNRYGDVELRLCHGRNGSVIETTLLMTIAHSSNTQFTEITVNAQNNSNVGWGSFTLTFGGINYTETSIIGAEFAILLVCQDYDNSQNFTLTNQGATATEGLCTNSEIQLIFNPQFLNIQNAWKKLNLFK